MEGPPGKGWPPAVKRVLRGDGAIQAAKRRQRARRAAGLNPETAHIEGAGAHLGRSDGSTDAPKRPGAEVPPGSESVARAQGFVQEPGRSRCLHRQRAGRPTGVPRPRPTDARTRPTWERNDGVLGWYRRASKEKRGGKGAGSRSALIVPRKRGNRPEGPRGGKGSVGSRNCWRERLRERRIPRLRSQRNCSG